MMDCGADAVVCHRTHYISDYEYFKNKPIFYGLGNFFAQSQEIERFPADFLHSKGLSLNSTFNETKHAVSKVILNKSQWWRRIAAQIEFDTDFNLTRIELIPIEIDKNNSGWPTLAKKETAELIAKRMQKLSLPFKTNLSYMNKKNTISIDKT